MKIPDSVKLAFGSVPVPGFRRALISDTACTPFDGGQPAIILHGIQRRFQCYVVRSGDYAARRQEPPETLLSREAAHVIIEETRDSAVLYPSCVELDSTIDELDPTNHDHLVVLSKWSAFYTRQRARLDTLFSRVRPHIVVYFQGFLPESAILRELALERRVPFLAVERSAFNQRMTWDNVSGFAVNRNCARNHYWRNEMFVEDAAASDFAQQYLLQINSTKQAEHESPNERFMYHRPNQSSLKIAFLGQVFTDTSVLFGQSGDLSPLRILDELTEFAQANEHSLMIKLHPKERNGQSPLLSDYRSLTYRRMQDYEWRCPEWKNSAYIAVDSDNRWNTNMILSDADLVITQSSQAGIEAALMGKDVILCGESFYRGLGFTIDVRDRADLRHTLKSYRTDPIRTRQHTRHALRFFYSFCNHYCIERSTSALFNKMNECMR